MTEQENARDSISLDDPINKDLNDAQKFMISNFTIIKLLANDPQRRCLSRWFGRMSPGSVRGSMLALSATAIGGGIELTIFLNRCPHVTLCAEIMWTSARNNSFGPRICWSIVEL